MRGRRLVLVLLWCLSVSVWADHRPSSPSDGEAHRIDRSTFEVWDAEAGAWVTPEAFWDAYAKRRGGLNWARSRAYPEYSSVSERDLFLVELDSGVCLMEFWHSRWRRANDVRRWNGLFNGYGGCPDVFK